MVTTEVLKDNQLFPVTSSQVITGLIVDGMAIFCPGDGQSG